MEFNNLRINKIDNVLFYKPTKKSWIQKNRKNHIIGVQLSGSALHTMGAKTLLLSSDCIFFLNKKDDYKVFVYEPGESLSVHFSTTDDVLTDSFCIPIVSQELISSLKKLKHCYETNNELLSLSLLYNICAIFQAIIEKEYFSKNRRMTELKQYIDANYYEKKLLEAVISMSGLSSRRFTDLFKKHFNVTPNRYITLCRINAAKTLLETNMFSITSVAEQCGFSNVYYFSKVFKKETGISPSKYNSL